MLTTTAPRLPGRRSTLIGAALGGFALAGLLAGPAPAQGRAPEGFADLAAKLLPSVVNISTTQVAGSASGPGAERGPEIPQFPPGSPFEEFFKEFFERQQRNPNAPPRRSTSLGSGFIIDAAGLIVTNNHVIDGADEITVILHDDTKLPAKLVGKDPKTDMAVLRVEPKKPLPAVKFGSSDKARVGDWIVAIGNPFGLGGSVTAGILSARQRDISAGPYDDFLQTDASINRGNSGGPMFNLAGEVIGINTAIYSPSGGSVGIGFAVPSDLARPVVDQLIKYGRTRRGWLGVRIQQVTDEIAESLQLTSAQGALVASVSENGPAAKAGIEAGDVVIRFDNRPVENMRRLPRMVAETEIEKKVDVVVWRKGKEVKTQVALGELEEAEKTGAAEGAKRGEPKPGGKGPTVSSLGMTLAAISDELRKKYGLAESLKGVVVTEVAGNSPAAEKGLRPGDVIVEVGQEEVASPDQVTKKVADAKKAGRKTVLLLIDRKGDLRFEAVRIDQG